MIIIITGSSHVGKTVLSQKLMERIHFPYLSLDHLKMAFIRLKMTDLTVEDDFEMRSFLWPFAAEIIKTAIENEQNLIVEGCYVPDNWKEFFSTDYLRSIRIIYIVMSETYIRQHLNEIASFADVIERRKEDFIDQNRLIACSREFKEYCVQEKLPYLEIDEVFDEDLLTDRILSLVYDSQ